MAQTSASGQASAGAVGFALTPQQIAFFETFGFVKLPGLFADDIDEIAAGFEAVFGDETNPRLHTNEELHLGQSRVMMLSVVDHDERLARLKTDPRVQHIVETFVGPDYEYAQSDGSLFYCETSWHPDTYGAPMKRLHIKLSFYLDPLGRDTGAIRVIPGTNHWQDEYALTLRSNLLTPDRVTEVYGIDARDIPSWAIETDPGDLIVWSYRTIHASFGGGGRRRAFFVSFREPADAD